MEHGQKIHIKATTTVDLSFQTAEPCSSTSIRLGARFVNEIFLTTGDNLVGGNNHYTLGALSACPDLAVGGEPVDVTIYEA